MLRYTADQYYKIIPFSAGLLLPLLKLLSLFFNVRYTIYDIITTSMQTMN